MDDENARLRQALAETERSLEKEKLLREKEKLLREKAERSQEKAERSQEKAERLREKVEQIARPQTLMPYLEACHSLNLAIQVDDFPARQEEIWEQLSEPSFTSQHQFPSQTQMDYVRSLIGSINNEDGLRYFERDTVENAVQKLIGAMNDNILLRDRLSLRGTVTFESHTNLSNTENNLTESLSLSEGGTSDGTSARTGPTYKAQSKIKGKGKGNRADNFCIYETSDGVNVPKIAIEYKAPHKLTQNEINTGLVSEVQPDRDIINKNSEDFTFTSKALAAAVVTQLFSYMISKGIQYRYISTGEAFVFLYIPDDASTVYYYISVPNLDVRDNDETRLYRTAVAQVFAFILQSLRAEPPSQVWHDAAATLNTWAVEYDDVLSRIPETRRFKRSPIRTRSNCRPPNIRSGLGNNSNDKDAPPSPTVGRSTRFGKEVASLSLIFSGRRGQGGRQQRGAERTRIQDRPYCTHHCLLGLAYGGPIDESCPNAESHGSRHIDLAKFKPLVRTQLAKDRGPDADSVPLYLSGLIRALLKIRLSAFGYTFVAKAVEAPCLKRLQHEEKMYDHLRSIQGEHVPVCLGLINLVLPYYYDGGVFRHLLLLSWGGRPLPYCTDQIDKTRVIAAVSAAFASLHRLQVLHGDAEARNITYDKGPMIVDLERAKVCAREPLGSIPPDSQVRKRNRDTLQKHGDDPFRKELRSVVESVSRCFGAVTVTMPPDSRLVYK
ncbi:hypothetical protein B0T17DRAFT_592179 [Bombardia bombarda]|uniref:Protein kinase domain-containing protein n=1 Tax=Bombardia bombarda TaxID=252184 RepID=A0AA39WMZ1_9PEZI|nr:hypothetical protein B0T17DRAFT_592179 [Bombardia bombarda]